MATTTIFPEPDVASTAGDGDSLKSNDASWDNTHDATDGNATNNNRVTLRMLAGQLAGGDYAIQRAFANFDVSGVPGTVDSATLDCYVVLIQNDDNDGDDFIGLVQATPASDTTLVDADFNQCGAVDSPTEGATREDLGGLTTSQYNSLILNATGEGWITAAIAGDGVLNLGLREGHDIVDSAISTGVDTFNIVHCSSAEETGTSQDIRLVIESTVAGAGGGYRRRRAALKEAYDA